MQALAIIARACSLTPAPVSACWGLAKRRGLEGRHGVGHDGADSGLLHQLNVVFAIVHSNKLAVLLSRLELRGGRRLIQDASYALARRP